MPYKSNESRRHKIPKARYRVTNWPAYDAALVRRGGLPVWFPTDAGAARQRAGAGGGGTGRPADLFGDRHRDGPRTSPGVPPTVAPNRGHAAIDRRGARG